jgi:D-alanine-D-alanine ligase
MANGQWGERRVLIPSLCKHYNIPYFGHNSYVMGILCNKSHYTSILKEFNISVPTSWVYDNKYGWTSQEPQYGQKVIIKPIYENNSTSITQESIIIYNQDNKSIIHELSLKFNQPILAQKFISGYEISVPVFSYKNQTIIPQVIGSKLNGNKKYGNNIVSESYNYTRRYEDINDKYFDFNDINEYTSKNIINDCVKISKVIGIESISRFDLRVDESFQYYFNDLGSIPGFLPKSSFEYVFIKHNFNYNDFLICSIVSDYIKYYSI